MNPFEAITDTLYRVISAAPDARDWASAKALFLPGATLVRTGVNENGDRFALSMSYDEYIANASELLEGVVFNEVELRQEVREFGNIAQLTSVYESSFRSEAMQVSGRGVNFFNLINVGDGWRIANMIWDNERDGVSLRAAGLMDR